MNNMHLSKTFNHTGKYSKHVFTCGIGSKYCSKTGAYPGKLLIFYY